MDVSKQIACASNRRLSQQHYNQYAKFSQSNVSPASILSLSLEKYSITNSEQSRQPGTTPTLVNITTPINIYQYNSQNLIISYGIGLFFAILAVIIGLASFATNGVSHSTSFSAMIAATRNRKLDELMEGYSLGDAVKDEKIAKTRLKFGAIKDAEGGEGENVGEKDVRRVAWGLEDDVVSLKKGGVYI